MAKNKLVNNRGQKTSDNFFRKTLSKKTVKPSTSNDSSTDFFIRPSVSNQEKQLHKKKVFNKNKWRSEKYSLKNKLDKWKDKRTDYIRHSYYKEQNREKNVRFDAKKVYEEEERRETGENKVEEEKNEEKPKRRKSLKDQLQEEKEVKRAEFLKRKAEKEEALKKYKKEKMEKMKKLNKKTKKGQPVMKGRLEYLLEKIQKNMSTV